MVKFLISCAVAIACLVGFVVAGAGFFLLTTPRPTNIKDCLTTAWFEVKLCPTDSSYVRLNQIAPAVRNAVIVSEDGNFYSHDGFDWFELQESFNRNLEKGEFARGGSTITQQLAKNVYLTGEKSLFRKGREAIITMQIEKILTKDEILEKYLNVVQFGKKIFGVRAASQHYFGKAPSQLNVAESAWLAFLLPSPEKYSVSFAKKKLTPFARSQMRQIVDRLARYKKISEDEHVVALAQVDSFFGHPADTAPISGDEAPSAEELGEGEWSEESRPAPQQAPQAVPNIEPSSEEISEPAPAPIDEVPAPSEDPVTE